MKPLQVVILDHSGKKICPESCGTDWLKEENRFLAKERIKQRFGEGVKIEFFDLKDDIAKREFPELIEKAEKEVLYLPILLINGQVRISGYFDIRMLLDMVEAERELGYV